MASRVKEVPFYEDGKIYATVTIEFAENGKKTLIPSPGYKLYPMDIRDVEVSEREMDPDLIQYWLIGDVRRRSYMVPVKMELYSILMAMEWSEAASNTLQRRCRIPDKNGLTKVCRRRSCSDCPHANKDRITSVPVSLDALKEVSNNEPSTGDVTSEAAMNKIAEEEFIAYLEHHDPKCASVYKMLKRGDSAVEIAKQLKLTDRMVRYYRSEAYNLRMQFNAE